MVVYGLKEARRLLRGTRRRMKGQSGDYVRGWRAALSELDSLLQIHINDYMAQHKINETRERRP
jgi:hypothetical protein